MDEASSSNGSKEIFASALQLLNLSNSKQRISSSMKVEALVPSMPPTDDTQFKEGEVSGDSGLCGNFRGLTIDLVWVDLAELEKDSGLLLTVGSSMRQISDDVSMIEVTGVIPPLNVCSKEDIM